jgi:tRNA-2-methylthio-N6-dimethylallyladenosine synthase
MRTYYLRSFGCQMNDHDAERIRALLEAEGLVRVGVPEQADLIAYNTCTVRRSADERFYGHLGEAARIKKLHPERLVVVCGCLAQAEGDSFLDEHAFVDIALGPQSIHCLTEAIRQGLRGRGFFDEAGPFSGELPTCRERPFQAWVQVMSGCSNACTYCIVPRVRGPERSRPADEVVAEVRGLVAEGVLEVTLLGQNVNAYAPQDAGQADGGAPFAALLRRLDELAGLERVRFTTSHPKDLSDDLIEAMASLPTVCEHLHLPAQSGSERSLRAMGRGYTMEHYRERAAALRQAIPDIAITTDLMVGFPGETEADFEETLALVREVGFDGAFTFVFSPRPGTAAAGLPDQVPAAVAGERIERLVAATQEEGLRRHEGLVGKRVEVLVEGPGRHGDVLRGRSRQNVTVNFSGEAGSGQLVLVMVEAATSTTLRGQLAS